MKILILLAVLYVLYRALPTILDIVNARMAAKNAQLQRETEMLKRQTEQLRAAKNTARAKLSGINLGNDCIAPWLIEEQKKNLIAAGMQAENADAFIEELIKTNNLDVDYGYERYTLSPVLMKKEAYQHALLESLKDSFKRGVSREARIAFWLRCNPGKTEQDAQVAVVASELIRE
ncbi:MAG: hypothetical protein IKU34_02815 [Clostridia bacterium]|nr:hypothetical protein [Clostridia bacterium]